MKPSEEYTIHVLSNEDFDALPVGKPLEALGMTDAKRKIAWVRQTGVRDLDQSTINHEFDELMAKTSHHEIDGIRYKSAGKIFRNVASVLALAIPGGGPFISAGIQGIGAFSDSKRARAERSNLKHNFDKQNAAFQRNQFVNSNPFAITAQGPLSDQNFAKGNQLIDNNLTKRKTALTQRKGFRGQGIGDNTALATAFSGAEKSNALTKQDFSSQQDFARNELDQQNKFVAQQRTALADFDAESKRRGFV